MTFFLVSIYATNAFGLRTRINTWVERNILP